MRFRGSVVLSFAVFAAVVVGAGLALWPIAGDAQEGDLAKKGTTRYRVTVLRVSLPPDSHGDPVSFADLGGEVAGALVPASGAPGATGHFGAVPDRPDLIEAIGRKGTGYEVIFRGEAESVTGRQCQISYGQRFPIQSVDVRGNQMVVTTKWEKVGFKLQIERSEGPIRHGHQAKFEVSSVSATKNGRAPTIFEVSAEATIQLPDGYTAIYSYLDRVEGFCFANTPESIIEGIVPTEMPPDIVNQYMVLITRLDLK